MDWAEMLEDDIRDIDYEDFMNMRREEEALTEHDFEYTDMTAGQVPEYVQENMQTIEPEQLKDLSSNRLKYLLRRAKYRVIPANIQKLLQLMEAYEGVISEKSGSRPDPVILTNMLTSIANQSDDVKATISKEELRNMLERIQTVATHLADDASQKEIDEAYIPKEGDPKLNGTFDKHFHMFSLKYAKEEERREALAKPISEIADDGFSQYQPMSKEEAETYMRENSFNKTNTQGKNDFVSRIYTGKYAYVNTSNASKINQYLRGKAPEKIFEDDKKYTGEDFDPAWEGEAKHTIAEMDKATQVNKLSKNTKFFRMLRKEYLEQALGLGAYIEDDGKSINPAVVEPIQKMAGTVLSDASFMSVGFQVDLAFEGCPIMLTLLCDKGTKVFVTGNLPESEVILGRNTAYMILGARLHNKKRKKVEISGNAGEGLYSGLEIFAKVVNTGGEKLDNATDENTERYRLMKELEESKRAGGGENSANFQMFMASLKNVEEALDANVSQTNYEEEYKRVRKAYDWVFGAGTDYLKTHKTAWTRKGRSRRDKVSEVVNLCRMDWQLIEQYGNLLSTSPKANTWRNIINENGTLLTVNPSVKQNIEGTLQALQDRVATDKHIMTSEQFKQLILRVNDAIPSDVQELIWLLDTYEKNRDLTKDDKDKSRVLSINAIHILTEQCQVVAQKQNSKLKSAIQVLGFQCARREQQLANASEARKNAGTTSGGIAESTEEVTLAGEFSDYGYLTNHEVKEMAEANPYNQGEYLKALYGKYDNQINDEGINYGYIRTSNSSDINSYLRDPKSSKDKKWEQKANKTIADMQNASGINRLPKKCRVHRMLSESYLKLALGINAKNVADQVVAINKMAGTVIQDSGFMCVGYHVDEMFASLPVMLTMLCEEGTPCFATINYAESELIFGRGTRYMILGAFARGENGLVVPLSNIMQPDNADFLENGKGKYRGLEIIVKVIK